MACEDLYLVSCSFKVELLFPKYHIDDKEFLMQHLVILFCLAKFFLEKKAQGCRVYSGPCHGESTTPMIMIMLDATNSRAESGWTSTGAEMKVCFKQLNACLAFLDW